MLMVSNIGLLISAIVSLTPGASLTASLVNSLWIIRNAMLQSVNLTAASDSVQSASDNFGGLSVDTVVILEIIIAILFIMIMIILLGFLSRSNRIIKQQRDRLLRITDNITEGLLVLDKDSMIRFANPRAGKLADRKYHNIINKGFEEVYTFLKDDKPLTKQDSPIYKTYSDSSINTDNDLSLYRKSGEPIPVELTCSPLYRKKNESIGALVIIRDISTRLIAEKNISHWKRRYEFVSTAANQVVYDLNLKDRTVKWSRSLTKVLGYELEEMDGGYEQWKELIHPEDMETVLAASRDAKENNTLLQVEYRFKTKRGNYLWIKEKGLLITDEKGEKIHLIGLMQDITEQKYYEEEILKFKQISDSANYGAAILDMEYFIIYINSYFAGIHGYKTDELIGKSHIYLYDETQKEKIELIGSLLENTGEFSAEEVWHRHRNGRDFPMLMNGKTIRNKDGKPLFVALTATDISERTEFIKALKESRDRFRNLVSNIPGVVYRRLADTNWTIKFISNEIENITGWNADEFLDNKIRSYGSIIVFDDRSQVGQLVYIALSEKKPWSIEYRIKHRDGSYRWIFERGRGVFDENGRIICCDGVIFDITERKNAEEALKESEERLKMKLDYILSPDVDVKEFALTDIIDPDKLQEIQNDFAIANGVASIITNPQGELITKPSNVSIINGIILAAVKNVIKDIKPAPGFDEKSVGKPLVRKIEDCGLVIAGVPIIVGGKHIANWIIGPVKIETEPDEKIKQYAVSTGTDAAKFNEALVNMQLMPLERFNDISRLLLSFAMEISALGYNNIKLAKEITYRKEAEASLLKSETELRDTNASKDKFFSIIAHDLKSPLAALRSMIGMLDDSLEEFSDEEIKEVVHEMNQSGKQVYELLEDLLSWSRAQTGKIQYHPDNFDISIVAVNVLTLLKANAEKKDINLHSKIKEGTVCYADPNMISTVLRNLISNALKFTNTKGEVFIDSKETDSFLEISVNDNGVGISKENLEKLFRIDVHLTTIGTSNEKGTGLGLILCKEFIETNDGRIWVESEPGNGTSFKFTLPKANNGLKTNES